MRPTHALLDETHPTMGRGNMTCHHDASQSSRKKTTGMVIQHVQEPLQQDLHSQL